MGSTIVRIDHLFISIVGNIPSSQDQNPHRKAAYSTKEFHYVGIVAVVDVSYPINTEGKWPGLTERRTERFTSEGSYAIESDSSPSHFRTVAKKELVALKSHLERFFIDTSAAFSIADIRIGEGLEIGPEERAVTLFRLA